MGVFSFPSLVLEDNEQLKHIIIDYTNAHNILKQLEI
jgi:protein-disulfide isomerase-like protein with CxxC motif